MKIIIFLIIIAGTIIAQERELTLRESIEIGLQNSKELKISKSRLSNAKSKVDEVNSQFLPQFKLYSNMTFLSDNIPPFEVKTQLSPNPIRISDPILNNYTIKFGFTQPLFTGFKLISWKSSAEKNKNAAESDYSREENEVAFNIYLAFWNFYKSQKIEEVVSRSAHQMEQHLKDAQNFYNNGLLSKNDLLKLEVQNSNTKLMLIDARNNLELSRIAFNKALGLELNDKTKISSKHNLPIGEEIELAEAINEAINNRKELKSLSYSIDASRDGIRAAQSGWLPSIYLSGNYNYSNPNQRFQPPQNEFNYNWELGVTLSWDVWDWGLTSSKVSQAEQTKIQLETNLSKLKDNIQLEVYSDYLNLSKTEEKVKVNWEALNQAHENYRIVADKFNVQLATSTDLIDAETSLLQAETNLRTSEVDNQLAKVKLEKSLGRIIY